MGTADKIKELEEKKQALIRELAVLESAYRSKRIGEKQYFDQKDYLLEGKTEGEAFADIEGGIGNLELQRRTTLVVVSALAIIAAVLPFTLMDDLTGLAVFETDEPAITVNETNRTNESEGMIMAEEKSWVPRTQGPGGFSWYHPLPA